jgi:hypothetical protein
MLCGLLCVMIRGNKKGQQHAGPDRTIRRLQLRLTFYARLQAACTDVLTNLTSVLIKSGTLNIRFKLALSLFL